MTESPKMTVRSDGTRSWWLNNQLHRSDGPAVEWADGTRSWYLHGEQHRSNGPAVEYLDGSCTWYQHDKRHRSDGPAVEWADGTRAWYLHGQQLTFEQWLAQTTADPAERVMLALRWANNS